MAFGKFAVDYEQRVDYDRLRRERLARAQAQMAKDGVGAILSFDCDNIRYLTSYYVTTPMRGSESQAVFCPRKGEPYLVVAGIPEETERRMPWMKGRIIPLIGMPRLAAIDSNDPIIAKYVEKIGSLLAEHGLTNEPFGIDGSTLQLLFGEAFGRKGIKVIHGKPTLDYARAIKTEDEISLIRISCANAEKAFAAVVDAIRPGAKECDLVAAGIKALYEEGVDHTEDLVCMSGENTNPYGLTFTDRMIRPHDLIYVDVDGSSYQGYKTCIYRTFCCGKASNEQKELYEECRDMLYNGIKAVRDGATDHDILKAWPDSPRYWGYDSWNDVAPLAVGHGLGLTLHDRPFINNIHKALGTPPYRLEAGMVLALETWTGKKGGKDGVRLEEMILVKKDGYEVLSRFPIETLIECWIPY
jgi:Xaa-Pro aminopeptidase